MLRVLIFGFAVVVVFTGLITVMPILEGTEGERQVAAVVARPEVLPSCIISAHPEVVSPGEEVSVAWGSEMAFVAWLSDVGEVPLQGGMFVTPSDSTTYTLTVGSYSGKAASCSTEIMVH